MKDFLLHNNDPLAFVSNVSQPSSSTQIASPFPEGAQQDSGCNPMDELLNTLNKTIALLSKSHLPQTNNQLRTASNTRNQATIQNGRVVVQNVQARQRGQGNNQRGAVANPGQARGVKCYNCGGMGHIARNCTELPRPHNSEYYQDKMLLMQAKERGVQLDEEQLLFLAEGDGQANDAGADMNMIADQEQDLAENDNNIFQADQIAAFDSDVDDDDSNAAQTMFMANLTSNGPVYDDAGPSYDSDGISEVPTYDNDETVNDVYLCEHEMHSKVQSDLDVDSDSDNMNMISYDQYIADTEAPIVQSDVSPALNDDVLNIIMTMKDQVQKCHDQNEHERNLNKSLTNELARCREQMEKEVKNLQNQLNSTKESLANEFKEKEDKYLDELVTLKKDKEQSFDALCKFKQSSQTVHMLCKPKPFYDEENNMAIGHVNPLNLANAQAIQPVLYDGHSLLKTDRSPTIVSSSEETLEIADQTRLKMLEKVEVANQSEPKARLNFGPPNYIKENHLATFVPQKEKTPEQMFWVSDLAKEFRNKPRAKVSKPKPPPPVPSFDETRK